MRYRAGSLLTFEGRGADPEDGGLPASAFTWWVELHEGSRVYPFVPRLSGMARGTFTVPAMEATSAPRWYRIHLEVRDSRGNASTVFRDVFLEEPEPAEPPRRARALILTPPAAWPPEPGQAQTAARP